MNGVIYIKMSNSRGEFTLSRVLRYWKEYAYEDPYTVENPISFWLTKDYGWLPVLDHNLVVSRV